jgi:hypothetical protein
MIDCGELDVLWGVPEDVVEGVVEEIGEGDKGGYALLV